MDNFIHDKHLSRRKYLASLNLSLEELDECDAVSEFTITFIQSLIKTGYYSPNHPGAKKAVSNLFPSFTQIIRGKNELTYIARNIGEEKEIIVDGLFREPFALKHLLKMEMTGVFINKFVEYFERKNLISFSMKNNITQEEFNKFVELMSAASISLDKKEAIQELTHTLVENNIVHISTIFNEDAIGGRERKLPWRVELTLTRIRKDLRMIPLYKNRSEKDLQKIKKQILADIIRPIRRPDILKEILVNCDLIDRDVKEVQDIEIVALEDDIIEYINQEFIIHIISDLLSEIEEGQIKLKLPSRYNMAITIIHKTIPHLYVSIGVEELALFRRLFNANILALDKLPVELKDAIIGEKLTDTFLLNSKKYLEHFSQITKTEDYSRISGLLIRIIPELIKREKYPEFESIIGLLNNHKRNSTPSFQWRTKYAVKVLEKIINEEVIKYLVENFHREEDFGDDFFELIAEFGKANMGMLIKFVEHDQEIIRRNACKILARMGENVLEPLLRIVQKEHISWHILRNIFMVFGDIGVKQENVIRLIKENIHNIHFRVREEVLFSLYKILGKEAEHYLINALTMDKDIHVTEKACQCLCLLRSSRDELISYLSKNLKKRYRPLETYISRKKNSEYLNDKKDQEGVEVKACYTINNMAEYLDEKCRQRIESVLITALKIKKGIVKLIFFSMEEKSEKVRIEICEILGMIGGKKSIPSLKKVIKGKKLLLQQAAAAALKKIEERIT